MQSKWTFLCILPVSSMCVYMCLDIKIISNSYKISMNNHFISPYVWSIYLCEFKRSPFRWDRNFYSFEKSFLAHHEIQQDYQTFNTHAHQSIIYLFIFSTWYSFPLLEFEVLYLSYTFLIWKIIFLNIRKFFRYSKLFSFTSLVIIIVNHSYIHRDRKKNLW